MGHGVGLIWDISFLPQKILKGETIKIFNNGDMMRDFTYIDDIVDGIKSLIYKGPAINNNFDLNMPKPSESWAPFKLFNLGNSTPIKLMSFIRTIEENLGIEAKKEFLPMQMGMLRLLMQICNY